MRSILTWQLRLQLHGRSSNLPKKPTGELVLLFLVAARVLFSTSSGVKPAL